MTRILILFGTRPEAIKLAPIIRELKKRKVDFKSCVTAQHRGMLDQALKFFEIEPDYDLDLMQANQSLNEISSRILEKIDKILEKENPGIVLVHGDTTTSFITALAAFHRGIKVAHVEAGLRTYKKYAPYPEEINRQLTARIADFNYAPTSNAKINLLNEHISSKTILVTGNTIVDALNWGISRIRDKENPEIRNIKEKLSGKRKLILVTGHRRENFGKGFGNICEALKQLAKTENVEIIYPLHLNPKVKQPVERELKNRDNIFLIRPVSYATMIWLMKSCDLIISDSGGIQEEAPTFNKPVLVTREFSERMEGVEAGFSVLVGTKTENIIYNARQFLTGRKDLNNIENPYGDGKASEKIVEHLLAVGKETK